MGLKRHLRRLLGRSPRAQPGHRKESKPPKPPKPPLPAAPDPFPDLVARYERRLARDWHATLPPVTERASEIAFLITPWLGTAVPMFNIELALLVRSQGQAARLLFDDSEVIQNAGLAGHRAALSQLVASAAKILPVTRVSSLPPATSSDEDAGAARRICENIAIWWERGETTAPAFHERNPDAVRHVAAHLAKVRGVLTALKPCRLVIPGGIFGLSPVYVHAATEIGLPFTTFDSNPKVVMISHDSVACHRRDFPRVLERIKGSLTETERQSVHLIAHQALQTNQQGRDDLRIQVTAHTQEAAHPCDILVPLNIRWDAAALGCELCFPSCRSWLEALLFWVERDGRHSICLREHPAERFSSTPSRDDWPALLQRFSSLGARLRFISADEPVNTYDLIASCKLVLPYTSTIGIEAAMLGKPVVTHTSAYYASAGFAWAASSASEYLHLVGDALDGRLVMDEARRASATMAFYLANCAWFLPGEFNPHSEPFMQWSEIAPAQLLETTSAREIVSALIHGEYVPACLHARNMVKPTRPRSDEFRQKLLGQ